MDRVVDKTEHRWNQENMADKSHFRWFEVELISSLRTIYSFFLLQQQSRSHHYQFVVSDEVPADCDCDMNSHSPGDITIMSLHIECELSCPFCPMTWPTIMGSSVPSNHSQMVSPQKPQFIFAPLCDGHLLAHVSWPFVDRLIHQSTNPPYPHWLPPCFHNSNDSSVNLSTELGKYIDIVNVISVTGCLGQFAPVTWWFNFQHRAILPSLPLHLCFFNFISPTPTPQHVYPKYLTGTSIWLWDQGPDGGGRSPVQPIKRTGDDKIPLHIFGEQIYTHSGKYTKLAFPIPAQLFPRSRKHRQWHIPSENSPQRQRGTVGFIPAIPSPRLGCNPERWPQDRIHWAARWIIHSPNL
jgi:hypothetical protein